LGTSNTGPYVIDGNDHRIGDQDDRSNEFAELARTPCALEILPAIEDRRRVENDGEDVLLDEGRSEEGPRVIIEEGGNEGEVGNDRGGLNAAGGSVKLSPSGNIVEEGQSEQADEEDTGSRGNVNLERHYVSRTRDRRLVGPGVLSKSRYLFWGLRGGEETAPLTKADNDRAITRLSRSGDLPPVDTSILQLNEVVV